MRLLHSFAGAVPFTSFMLLDLWANAKAAEGRVAFEHALIWARGVPRLAWLALLTPLAFHAAMGLALAVRGLGASSSPVRPTPAHTLQRATGVIALGYVAERLVRFWWPVLRADATLADVRSDWVRLASSTVSGMPLAAYVWLLALFACAFHMGHGLVLASARFGLAPSRQQRAKVTVAAGVLAVAAFVVGAHGVFRLATGWGLLPTRDVQPVGSCSDGSV